MRVVVEPRRNKTSSIFENRLYRIAARLELVRRGIEYDVEKGRTMFGRAEDTVIADWAAAMGEVSSSECGGDVGGDSESRNGRVGFWLHFLKEDFG